MKHYNTIKVVKETTVYIRDAQRIDFVKAIVGMICLCIITIFLIQNDGQFIFIVVIIAESLAFLAGVSVVKYLRRNGNDKKV